MMNSVLRALANAWDQKKRPLSLLKVVFFSANCVPVELKVQFLANPLCSLISKPQPGRAGMTLVPEPSGFST